MPPVEVVFLLEGDDRASFENAVAADGGVVISPDQTAAGASDDRPRIAFVSSETELSSLEAALPGEALRAARLCVVAGPAVMRALSQRPTSSAPVLLRRLRHLEERGFLVDWLPIDPVPASGFVAAVVQRSPQPASREGQRTGAGDLCDLQALGWMMGEVLPVLERTGHPNDLTTDDCRLSAEDFAAIACVDGFRSHLWGELGSSASMVRRGRGVMFISVGDDYLPLTEFAAASIKRHNPGLQVAVVSERPRPSRYFDHLVQIPNNGRLLDRVFRETRRMESMKLISIPLTPFEHTLFLDSDTFTIGPVEQVFDEAAHLDVALTNEADCVFEDGGVDGRPSMKGCRALTNEASYNAGVFLYRDNAAAQRYMTAWWAWYLWAQAGPYRTNGNWGQDSISDQSVLHMLVWAHLQHRIDVKLGFVPNTTYNSNDRMWARQHAEGRWNEARILHSKLPFHNRDNADTIDFWDLPWPRQWA